MSENGTTVVDAKLRQAWARERALANLRGFCVLALGVLSGAPLYVLCDWLFNLPWLGRWVVVLVLAGALGRAIFKQWWLRLRRFDPARAALQVEHCYPELASRLISYVQLTGGEAGASPQLVAAVRAQAADAAVPLDFERIVDFGCLKWLYMAVAVGTTFFLFCGLFAADYGYIAARRLFEADARYPTRTQVAPLKSDLSVAQGAAAEVGFCGRGMVPNEGVLRIQFAGERGGDEVTLLRGSGGIFNYRVQNARKSFTCVLALGDAVSAPVTVHVVAKPGIKGFTVVCTAPQYTHRLAESQDKTLNLHVPEGAQIEWSLVFDQPVARLWLKMAPDAQKPQITLAADGTGAIVRWRAEHATSYRFGLTPREFAFDFTDDVEYSIEVKPDEPPRVEIIEPANNDKATLAWKGSVKFRASDDYGLVQGRLIYWLNDGAEQRRELGKLAGNPAEQEVSWPLRDGMPQLRAGDVVNYCVEVCDNYPGEKGPHWVRSQVQTLGIVSQEDYILFIRAERDQLNADLDTIMKAEESNSQAVRGLRDRLQH